MNAVSQELLARALELPREERTELLAELAESLEADAVLDADPTFLPELERRARRAWSGASFGTDAELVLAQIEARLTGL